MATCPSRLSYCNISRTRYLERIPLTFRTRRAQEDIRRPTRRLRARGRGSGEPRKFNTGEATSVNAAESAPDAEHLAPHGDDHDSDPTESDQIRPEPVDGSTTRIVTNLETLSTTLERSSKPFLLPMRRLKPLQTLGLKTVTMT
ncbi:hypothetical protein PMIN06_003401 [Paraphaeosphaeria minitans]